MRTFVVTTEQAERHQALMGVVGSENPPPAEMLAELASQITERCPNLSPAQIAVVLGQVAAFLLGLGIHAQQAGADAARVVCNPLLVTAFVHLADGLFEAEQLHAMLADVFEDDEDGFIDMARDL